MSDNEVTPTEVTITPVKNGFFVYVSRYSKTERYVAQDVDRMVDVLHKVFPATAKMPPYVPPVMTVNMHKSDCAIYNEPASHRTPCDCGAVKPVMMPVTGGANG